MGILLMTLTQVELEFFFSFGEYGVGAPFMQFWVILQKFVFYSFGLFDVNKVI
jgi:hypothetical protein